MGKGQSNNGWLLPVTALVAAQWAIISVMALSVGFQRPAPILDSLLFSLPLAAISAVILMISSNSRDWRMGFDMNRVQIYSVWAGILLLTYQMALLTWAKTLLPVLSGGFWADPSLADLDYLIFGTDPWRLARKLEADWLIASAYGAWIPITCAAIVAIFMASPSDAKDRAILSFFSLWAFGTIFQFAAPSAGPLFFTNAGWGDRFAPMYNDLTFSAQHWLWKFHVEGTVKAGIGISAMPSMHVALSAWLIFAARSFARILVVPAIVFFGLIFLGSVYLGLHYFTDGAVATGAAWLIHRCLGFRLGAAFSTANTPVDHSSERT